MCRRLKNNAPLATVVAAVLEDSDAPDEVLSAQTSGDTLSTAESNQRIGSTWLFVIIALIAGIALGAGYISYADWIIIISQTHYLWVL